VREPRTWRAPGTVGQLAQRSDDKGHQARARQQERPALPGAVARREIAAGGLPRTGDRSRSGRSARPASSAWRSLVKERPRSEEEGAAHQHVGQEVWHGVDPAGRQMARHVQRAHALGRQEQDGQQLGGRVRRELGRQRVAARAEVRSRAQQA